MGVENGSVTMQPETLKDGRMRKRKRGMIQNGDSSLRWGQHKRSRFVKPTAAINSVHDSNVARPCDAKRTAYMQSRNAEHHAEPLHFSSWEAVNNPPDQNFGKDLGSSGNSAINRTAHSNGQTHRRTEVESLHDKPMVLGKLNLEFFRWPRVLISLSHKEKEDDFMAIKGSKLPQRPRRRDKHVEKSLSYVSPGTWLCELTRERYEVREKKSLRRETHCLMWRFAKGCAVDRVSAPIIRRAVSTRMLPGNQAVVLVKAFSCGRAIFLWDFAKLQYKNVFYICTSSLGQSLKGTRKSFLLTDFHLQKLHLAQYCYLL